MRIEILKRKNVTHRWWINEVTTPSTLEEWVGPLLKGDKKKSTQMDMTNLLG